MKKLIILVSTLISFTSMAKQTINCDITKASDGFSVHDSAVVEIVNQKKINIKFSRFSQHKGSLDNAMDFRDINGMIQFVYHGEEDVTRYYVSTDKPELIVQVVDSDYMPSTYYATAKFVCDQIIKLPY